MQLHQTWRIPGDLACLESSAGIAGNSSEFAMTWQASTGPHDPGHS